MTESRIPTDAEMNQIFHEEVRRTVVAISQPLGQVLDKHEIGKGMPPRIAACVVLHSLMVMGISLAQRYKLPKEAIIDILQMSRNTLDQMPDPNTD